MARTDAEDPFIEAAPTDAVTAGDPELVTVDGQAIALFYHEGEYHAIDNRCPHMGFPLTEGSVENGILTCHWHHARFELDCGDTFDPFADDVQTFPLEVRDGHIYVNPDPEPDKPPAEHWKHRLEHGLQENLSLVIAKSVIGLDDAGVAPAEAVGIGTEFGTHYREMGWGRGLTTLGVMVNLLDDLRPEDRRRALYSGLTEVADNCAGEPPFFVQEPLGTGGVNPDRLNEWFRDNIEVRDADGAERVLRTAIQADLPESAIVGMLVGAATDHLYLDTGHRLDFINKAIETLDHIGWDHADAVLPSLIPGLATASRAEENSSWRQPIDIAGLLFDTYEDLPDLVTAGDGREWHEPENFIETLLADDPHRIVDALTDAIESGATATELAQAVTFAGARRIAHFGTANEFNDWNTVHHTYTYANAVYGVSCRTDAWEVYRGVFDAAMNVYLDRFLNTPPAPIPGDTDSTRSPDAVLDDLMETFEVEGREEVDRAGRYVGEYIDVDGDIDELKRALGQALLREDAGFHTRQNVEAAFNQHAQLSDPDRKRTTLIATARYLSAHTPTRREGEQTFRIAERLHRGERLHEAAGDDPATGTDSETAADD
ncbi:MAG: Rieske (2Fe-2S) protein [Halobacteriales archaeon]|nr:Rieske (2Fe-2S) protein [Halobacteriales archaeon]